jgi:hypothetical protein
MAEDGGRETGVREQEIDPEISPESLGAAPGGGAGSWATLAVIALGGAAGSLARYGLSVAFPHPAGLFDWATLGINVSGCALIGLLMVAVTEIRPVHYLARPFLVAGTLAAALAAVAAGITAMRWLARTRLLARWIRPDPVAGGQ